MAVPSSGELKLWQAIWNDELGGSKGQNSLHSASVYAGFDTPDAMGDFYGFSDVEVPTIATNSETSVGSSGFTANGNVTNTGNGTVTRGFYMGTNSSNPGTGNPKYTLPGTTTNTGTFSCAFTGLSSLTTYYYWAWGSNSAGETISSKETVTTTAPPFTPQYVPFVLCDYNTRGQAFQGVPSGTNTFLTYQYVNPYTSTLNTYINLSQPFNDTEGCRVPTCKGCSPNIGTCVVKNTHTVISGGGSTNDPGQSFCFDTWQALVCVKCNQNVGARLCCFAQKSAQASGTGNSSQNSPQGNALGAGRYFSAQGQPYYCRINQANTSGKVCFCSCLCSGL
jgi:hypothetical protein